MFSIFLYVLIYHLGGNRNKKKQMMIMTHLALATMKTSNTSLRVFLTRTTYMPTHKNNNKI